MDPELDQEVGPKGRSHPGVVEVCRRSERRISKKTPELWSLRRKDPELRTVVKRRPLGKADEVGAAGWGQGHAAIGHRRGVFSTDGRQRWHQRSEGCWDVAVVHGGLIDLELLSCGNKTGSVWSKRCSRRCAIALCVNEKVAAEQRLRWRDVYFLPQQWAAELKVADMRFQKAPLVF